jgi:hypothetical protein
LLGTDIGNAYNDDKLAGLIPAGAYLALFIEFPSLIL